MLQSSFGFVRTAAAGLYTHSRHPFASLKSTRRSNGGLVRVAVELLSVPYHGSHVHTKAVDPLLYIQQQSRVECRWSHMCPVVLEGLYEPKFRTQGGTTPPVYA